MGGDGVLKKELQRHADQLSITQNISFPGNIPWDRVPDLLAQTDIFVLPSIKDTSGNLDGLPTVLLEAMSSGCAVVASNIGGVSLVIEHGTNGLLVPPGDTGALASSILDLARNQQKRDLIKKNARQSIIEQYNWVTVTQKISDLLESAIVASKKTP
jgi:glycosyltransferase involved in cell wall biosynthesis